MVDVCYQSGIYLPEIDLWLDATGTRERSVVSHAHSDHVRPHRVAVTTPGTARLIEHRYRRYGRFVEMEYGERRDMGGFTLTLLPAGHVRGSAQALVEYRGERLLYSGDMKLSPSVTAEPATVPQADTLIVEATFGRPRYRFPPAETVIADIIEFCRTTLADGRTPVLLAYSLGKGQELLGRLAGAGMAIALHGTTFGVSKVYEQLGAEFPVYSCLDGAIPPGTVLITPAQARTPDPRSLPRARTALVTGWAIEPGARFRARTDAAFPLSDHADYDELIAYVRAVNPRRVYTVYGFDVDLAADLRALGYDAHPLKQPLQPRLL